MTCGTGRIFGSIKLEHVEADETLPSVFQNLEILYRMYTQSPNRLSRIAPIGENRSMYMRTPFKNINVPNQCITDVCIL